MQRAQDGARGGQPLRDRLAVYPDRPLDFRQPEIQQLHAVRGHQNIRGFQIAMDDPPAVRRIQGAGNLSGQSDGFACRDRAGQVGCPSISSIAR